MLATEEAAVLKAMDDVGMVALGYALVQAGQVDKGIAMLEAAIKTGDLKRPDDAKLRLGQAYASVGKKAQAITAFKSVNGKDGTADIAHYYIMALNRPLA